MKIRTLLVFLSAVLISGSAAADFSVGMVSAAKNRVDKLDEKVVEKKAAEEAIKIGAVNPLSGAYGASGQNTLQGEQLAVKHINAAGGVLGRQIVLISKDNAKDPEQAKAKVLDLVNDDNVSIIIGPLSSGVGMKMMEACIPNKVLLISPGNTSPDFTTMADDGYYWRTIPSDTLQAKVMAKIVDNYGYKNIGIILVDNAFGTGYRDVFTAAFEAFGTDRHVLHTVLYPEIPIQSSYATEVEQTFGNPTDIDACVFLTYFDDGAQIVNDGYAYDSSISYFGSDGVKGDSLITKIGNVNASNKVEGTCPAADTSAIQYQNFRTDFLAEFGEEPGAYTAHAYDATMLVALAIQKAGTATGEAIKSTLLSVSVGGESVSPRNFDQAIAKIKAGTDINYVGASSECDFDSVGDVIESCAQFEHWKCQGQSFVTVGILVP